MRNLKYKVFCTLTKKYIIDAVVFQDGTFNTNRKTKFLKVLLFTGIKDKKGLEIYEEDKVKTPTITGKVCWDEQYLSYFILSDNNSEDLVVSNEIEKISEIYDEYNNGKEHNSKHKTN